MDQNVEIHKPLVSVVMSVYNSASYLREAIDSILNQTYPNFEFLIINDGSTDDSLNIIKSYQDNRIVLINNDGNKGLIYSLNKGFEVATGKYIARMDGDDISLSTRFETQVSFLETNLHVGVVGCDYNCFDQSSVQQIESIHASGEIKSFLLFTATMCHPTLMLRKRVLEMNQFRYSENAKYVEDYDLWTRLIFKTNFSNIAKTLFKYRDHSNQVSHTFSDIQKTNSDMVREKYLSALGFAFSPIDLEIHNFIASNQRIRQKGDLQNIEIWLTNLMEQNKLKQIIDSSDFNHVMAKMWLDCCGNTKLGLWAYFKFQKSILKNDLKNKEFSHLKLFLKCIIRWIK
jgi:glycosyltransferase involved in cell wall biosynthesis